MEKANIETYLFPNITVVIFSLVNAIYLVGVHLCHSGRIGICTPGRIFSLRGLIPLKKILNPAETTVVCESYRFLSTALLLIEV